MTLVRPLVTGTVWRLNALGLAVASLAVLGPAAVVGYRRASPIVALGASYGVSVLTLALLLSDWTWGHSIAVTAYEATVVYGPRWAIVGGLLGYASGLGAYGVRRAGRRAVALTRT